MRENTGKAPSPGDCHPGASFVEVVESGLHRDFELETEDADALRAQCERCPAAVTARAGRS